ncbi:MAG: aspartate/glutamate racemase family protein [Pseudomonadota bacterium]
MKSVGLLGGMVPQSTVLVIQKLLSATQAQGGRDHIPLIINHNPQLPPRAVLVDDEDDREPMPALMSMAQDLERAGAQALAMPNVEAHHYSLAVSHATTLPFLDMVELSAAHIKASGANKIGLVAAPACRTFEVFNAIFDARGLTPVWLKDETAISDLIATAKNGTQGAELEQNLQAIANALMDHGAEHILVANAELSPLSETLPNEIPVTDSLSCLCEAIVAFAKS